MTKLITRLQQREAQYYSENLGEGINLDMMLIPSGSLIVADQKSEQVICVRCEKGKVHDFRLWKESKIRLNKEIEILGDKGYQGIQKIHQNSQIDRNSILSPWRSTKLSIVPLPAFMQYFGILLLIRGGWINLKTLLDKTFRLFYPQKVPTIGVIGGEIPGLFPWKLGNWPPQNP